MVIRKTILFLLLSSFAQAEKLEYFDSKIDFWGDKQSSKDAPKKEPSPTEKQDSKFPWKTFLDPKNKEFFKEGDYMPPEPFMEVARNPTDDNIKQWFELMKKKNELQTKLQERMAEYMAKNGELKTTPNVATAAPAAPKAKEQNVALDPSRFRLRMYFESTCPHCRRMFQVLKRLQDGGFQVEALQVDSGPVQDAEKIVPISRADPNDLKKHGIKGVPFLLIADTKRKALLPAIEGYHDFEDILRLLKAAN
ncbi:MAG: conjugal transfer protein TraF [Bdellovibrionaceae bacterium]|nr:conjugal transfer protein TraF [Pseudobdellovibrionaceae bacterium]